MLKYFKRKKSRHASGGDSGTETDNYDIDVVDKGIPPTTSSSSRENLNDAAAAANLAAKRHSLRSTSSFCDEIFLEELAATACVIGTDSSSVCAGGGLTGAAFEDGVVDDDTISYGALSLGALSSSYQSIGASAMALNTIVGAADEDLFKYHSRLSMSLATIVSEPNCLSYFVQYLDSKNALPLIKFYLDTENFKKAALAQIRKERRNNLQTTQLPKNVIMGIAEEDQQEQQEQHKQKQQKEQQQQKSNHSDDRILKNKKTQREAADGKEDEKEQTQQNSRQLQNADSDNKNVPELKTLCDLSMRKPLTDDEKSQIYAETNKQLTKSSCTAAASSESLSVCSLNSSITACTDITEANTNTSNTTLSATISLVSVKDALTIYQKYLSSNSMQYIDLPIELLAKISLVLCKTAEEEVDALMQAQQVSAINEENEDNNSATFAPAAACITTDCFREAQLYILQKLEKDFLNDFLQSTYYAKYCIELIETSNLNIKDILYSEVTLFYLMEYLEQHHERDCLDFWSTAINYRKSFTGTAGSADSPLTINSAPASPAALQKLEENGHCIMNKEAAQSDAMIVYEKFFSLQSETKLWSSNKLRSYVESCICSDDMIFYCFDLPLKVAAKYLERKYLKSFLKSALFSNYINELKTRIEQEDDIAKDSTEMEPKTNKYQPNKIQLRKCGSGEKNSKNRHRKTLSDCTLDKKLTISQHNTLLAAMDSTLPLYQRKQVQTVSGGAAGGISCNSTNLKQFHLNIDSLQLTNPNLLWQRSNSNNLKFGRINSLGRYERDFMAPSDVSAQQGFLKSSLSNLSSLTLGSGVGGGASAGHKFKNAMRKLINLPEDNLQEEIAWQVAEMIVKDVTSVTMGNGIANGGIKASELPTPHSKTAATTASAAKQQL